MYAGKYMKNPAPKRNHKSIVLLVSVFVLIFAMVGGTLAYLATNTKPVENTFQFGSSDVTIPEEIHGGVKSNVKVQNDGNIDVFVRAMIVVTWKDASGNVSATFPVENTDYTMMIGDGWFKGSDGFYYCKTRVGKNSASPVLITEARKTDTPNVPDGCDLSIEILAQSVQADGMKDNKPMVETIWTNVQVVGGQLKSK